MPFTLAHPALVLPLKKTKTKWSMTALIMGSMAPDFEFLLQMREVEIIGHSWPGIFIFDIPFAFLMCFLFHNLLRNSLLDNLPTFYQQRLAHFRDFHWNEYVQNNKWMFFLSLCVGVLSHFALDAFTHHDGLAVEFLPILSDTVEIRNHEAPVYFLLQLVISVVGMWFIHNVIVQMPTRQTNIQREGKSGLPYWLAFSMIFSLILCVRLLGWTEFNTFEGFIIALVGSTFYSWLLVSLIFKLNFNPQKNNFTNAGNK